MKKLLIFVFAAGLFFSCQHDFDDLHHTITNNTGEAITVLFHGESIPIPDNNTVNRTVNSGRGTPAPEIIAPAPLAHPRSIQLRTTGASTSGFDYTFHNVTAVPLHITNNLPIPVFIRADNFINVLEDANSHRQIEIDANASASSYTIFPRVQNPPPPDLPLLASPDFTLHRRTSPHHYAPLHRLPDSGYLVAIVLGVETGAGGNPSRINVTIQVQ